MPADEWTAIDKYAKVSPKKARLVMDMIRGKSVNEAQEILRFANKRAASYIDKVLRSAVANADSSGRAEVDDLYVATAAADDGTMLHRWNPGPMGRALPIKKRRSHLKIVVKAEQGD